MPWRSGRLDGEAGARIELDLPVLEARVEVEQDDEAVVDAGPPDAPLVHQRGGVGLGFGGRDVVATEGLGVDDDLGLGLGLDRVDDLLGLTLGRRRQDLGVVVDGLVVDRLGEWRSRGRGVTATERPRRPGRRRGRRARGRRRGGQDGPTGSMHGAHREAPVTIAPAARAGAIPSVSMKTCGARGRPL